MLYISPSRKRGIASEAMVEEALQQLTLKGEMIGRDGIRIIDFSRSTPNNRRDRDGIDFTITLDDIGQIPIQVKSSETQRRQFERRRRRKSKIFIPVIVVNWWEDIGKIMRKVKNCIILVLNIAKGKMNEEIHRKRLAVAKRQKSKFIRYHSPSMCH